MGYLGGVACGARWSPAAPDPGARAGVELRLQASRDGLVAVVPFFLFLLILILLLLFLLFVAVCKAPPPLHTAGSPSAGTGTFCIYCQKAPASQTVQAILAGYPPMRIRASSHKHWLKAEAFLLCRLARTLAAHSRRGRNCEGHTQVHGVFTDTGQ